jgi:hypothetical protein
VNEATLSRASGISTWAGRALPATARSSPALRTGVYAASAWQEINTGDLEAGFELARRGLETLTPESSGIASLYAALA